MTRDDSAPLTANMDGSSSQPSLQEDTYIPSRENFQSASDRYPPITANVRISSWLSQSLPAAMAPPSETHSDDQSHLGDSAYEFVDTDEESRDGNVTESIASTDYDRPNDIASVADSLEDTEQSDDESGSEADQDTHGIPEFGLDSPIETPTIGQSTQIFTEEVNCPPPHSIAFDEPPTLGNENVSVMHTIADFDEDQTADLLKRMSLQSPTKRLKATIRQTMAKKSLSTVEPFRLLYVGSHSAKHEIIHKIATSVAASVQSNSPLGSDTQRVPKLYTIVPVTEFGSERPPEIELLHSLSIQIKVDDCLSAMSVKAKDKPKEGNVIKLTMEDNCHYQSVPDDTGYTVKPGWELPHVAVIYCSENDTHEMRRTRSSAKAFMHRHKIPVILISHKQLFEMSIERMALDQHAIHMCLESRDSRSIPLLRLPIDLTSFLEIDPRQMNRNLAFLTGLQEPSKSAVPASIKSTRSSRTLKKTSYSIRDNGKLIYKATGVRWIKPIFYGLLITFFTALLPTISSYIYRSGNSLSINSNPTSIVPVVAVTSTGATASSASSAVIAKANETKTATKAVIVRQAKSSLPNSLSLLPSVEISKLSKKVQGSTGPDKVEPSALCAVEVFREDVFIYFRSEKLSWPARDSIYVGATRNNVSVEIKYIHTSTGGIILKFDREDAYGVLNISVITTKKQKMNETFTVDFGSKLLHELEDAFVRLSTHAKGSLHTLHDLDASLGARMESLIRQTTSQAHSVAKDARASVARATERAAAFSELSNILSTGINNRADSLSKKMVKRTFQTLANIREPLDEIIVRAQVQSKLYWLQLQGKTKEHTEYQQRAEEAIRRRGYDKATRARQEQHLCGRSWRTTKTAKKCGKAGS